eukprot:6472361-Amphidinium_carterae.1
MAHQVMRVLKVFRLIKFFRVALSRMMNMQLSARRVSHGFTYQFYLSEGFEKLSAAQGSIFLRPYTYLGGFLDRHLLLMSGTRGVT